MPGTGDRLRTTESRLEESSDLDGVADSSVITEIGSIRAREAMTMASGRALKQLGRKNGVGTWTVWDICFRRFFYFASIRTCLHIPGCKLIFAEIALAQRPHRSSGLFTKQYHQSPKPRALLCLHIAPRLPHSTTKEHVYLGSITKVPLFFFSLSRLLTYVNRHLCLSHAK